MKGKIIHNLRNIGDQTNEVVRKNIVVAGSDPGVELGVGGVGLGPPMGKGMGPGIKSLTPEEAGKIFDLKEKLHTDTAALRKQMMVKHAELAALWAAQKPEESAIQAKQKELNALRDQMQEKMTAFEFEAKKIAPSYHVGMGRGMGMGMGEGYGMGQGAGMGMGRGTGGGTAPKEAPAPPAK
jgi:Spy/CpxP family protein refolding chaperone